MKNKLILYIIGIIIFLVAIASIVFLNIKREKVYTLNDEIKLYKNQKVKVNDLNISLLSISDSTCPKNTQCIWQGEYSYELLVNEEKISLRTITLREHQYKNYNIVLSDKTSEKYIQFKITKIK